MIELQKDQLLVQFPEIHPRARCAVSFQRTLRVPDDGREYPLPAGLGRFPVRPVDDYPLPGVWQSRGGVFLPMHPAEALWLSFGRGAGFGFGGAYPFAVKVAAGKINALNGAPWQDTLGADKRDYTVLPAQPWLDGFCTEAGQVRQFVAMPLGEGVTAEEQITGAAEWGGLQLLFYPMKAEEYRRRFEGPGRGQGVGAMAGAPGGPAPAMAMRTRAMGMAPGGRIRQHVAKDPYGLDVWDTSARARCFVHLLDAADYAGVTGEPALPSPVTAKAYKDAGIPWFDHHFPPATPTLPRSPLLAALDGLASALGKKGKQLNDNQPIAVTEVVQTVQPRRAGGVRDGRF